MSLRRVLAKHKAAVGVVQQAGRSSGSLPRRTSETDSSTVSHPRQVTSKPSDHPPLPHPIPIPARFNTAFKQAIADKDTRAVKILWLGLVRIQRKPEAWMFNAVLCMHARSRAFNEALTTFKKMKDAGHAWTRISYNAMLHAYSQAGQPPYSLPPSVADDAKAVFVEMGQKGHTRSMLSYNWLILTQAKAALPDEAHQTYQLMLADGISPDHYTIGSLMEAYSRAGKPWKTLEVFDTLFALHQVQPNLSAWNSLLGAFAHADHKDGCFAVWQRMVAADIGSDEITQRLLAMAFGSNPQLANALVHEAKLMQDASKHRVKGAPNRQHRRAGQMHQVQQGIGPRGWAFLDLHGLSVAAAQLALQNRLQYIVSQPDLVVDAVDDTGLEIITGIGKHTHEDRTFGMKTAVEQVLQRHKLKHQQGSNPGVVRVPLPVLQRYLQLQLRQHLLSEFLHGAGWRYLTVFGGMFSAVSAMYVVPKLLLQT